jgi:ABC-type polysaccharide/polyol phosphate transport system ATPase subunit
MKAGRVVAEHVSRCFNVTPQRTRTLKDTVLMRGQRTREQVWALRDVSFEVESGESVGLIGRNGSGKTTLLRLIAGVLSPTEGSLDASGSVASLLELGAGFHPDFSGRDNVYLNASLHGLSRAYVREHLDEIVSFAEMSHAIDLPVRTYSAGMYVRLGFAVAIHLSQDIVLLDEVFAVGDEAFQRKCFGKILEFKRRGGTIFFVSHSASAVQRLCERAILLRDGRVEVDGSTVEAIARYHALLAAEEEPAERSAGLEEWGSGEIRVLGVHLQDAEGQERRQFLSGESVVIRVLLDSAGEVPAPRLAVEFRDQSGFLLGSAVKDAADLDWSEEGGKRELALELERLPLADGRFHVGVELIEPNSSRLYHHVERMAEFLVYPELGTSGLVRFQPRWQLAAQKDDLPVEPLSSPDHPSEKRTMAAQEPSEEASSSSRPTRP